MAVKKNRDDMTTIWIPKKVVKQLEELGHMHDNYGTVIQRLIDGKSNKPHERGITGEDEQGVVGDRNSKKR